MRLFIRITVLSLLFLTMDVYAAPVNDNVRRGEVLMSQRDIEQAIFFFTRAIEETPNAPKAYMLRARAFLMLNKYHEAVEDYRKAAELDPVFVREFRKKNELWVEDAEP